eukprot:9331164-Heterocapsa_arctica.AAC.1
MAGGVDGHVQARAEQGPAQGSHLAVDRLGPPREQVLLPKKFAHRTGRRRGNQAATHVKGGEEAAGRVAN